MAMFSYAPKISEVWKPRKEVETSSASSGNIVENDTTNTGRLKNKVCLVILDGWGLSDREDGNAVRKANTPVMDKLLAENSIELMAHGQHVGLPENLNGNSEVGHLNIGAGRVVLQDILRIDQAIKDRELGKNKTLLAAIGRAKQGNGRIHLAGLVSDGGVHSHINHLVELVKIGKSNEIPELFVHFFADGRDTTPNSGAGFLGNVLDLFEEEKYGKLATIVGRYYAMDRDRRWERTCKAYEAMVGGEEEECKEDQKAVEYMKMRYNDGKSDEFLKPMIFGGDERRIKKEDTVLFFNCRGDRMRQIVEVIANGPGKHFKSKYKHPENVGIFGVTQYSPDLDIPTLFPPPKLDNVLTEWLSVQGVSQFHCAETEKYAHVTYFFNGGREDPFKKEKRCLIHSPNVETYDKQPEMSSAEIANNMLEYISNEKRPFLMCNLAGPDMVGHTGDFDATVKAIEAADETIGWLLEACKKHGYILLVTADHGNAEMMTEGDKENKKHTAHTCSPVPFACSSKNYKFRQDCKLNRPAALCDVASTILDIMGLPKPNEMTGVSLLKSASGEEKEGKQDESEEDTVNVSPRSVETYPQKEEDKEGKEFKTAEVQTDVKSADLSEMIETTKDEQKGKALGGVEKDENPRDTERKGSVEEKSADGEAEDSKSGNRYFESDIKPLPYDDEGKEAVQRRRRNSGAARDKKEGNESELDNEKNRKKQEEANFSQIEKATIEKDPEEGGDVVRKHRQETAREVRKEYRTGQEELAKEFERKEERNRKREEGNRASDEDNENVDKPPANRNYMEKKGTDSQEKEEAVEIKDTGKGDQEDVEVTAIKGRSR